MKEADKLHQTEFRISLRALRRNLETFSDCLEPKTKLMLMLKASAYGHSSTLLAREFEGDERISYFAVAYVDEGVELRKAGIEKNILVLNPSPNSFDKLVNHCLEPEIHNLDLLRKFNRFLDQHHQQMAPYPVHLKFNTGMNRLGFEPLEIPQLASFFSSQKNLRTQSIMTHLSSSDLPKEDEFTKDQLTSFAEIIKATTDFQDEDTFFHCLNSNGIYRFPEHQYDLARLGIGLYGTSTIPQLREKLIPAASLHTKVCQIRNVKKGDSISYSRSGRAPQDTQIATLSIGYADGFNRFCGNGRWQVEIDGELYPTIGNVCMDLSMVDIGHAEVQLGDEVTIFGGKKSIYEYATHLGTITYEVMCALGSRVRKKMIA